LQRVGHLTPEEILEKFNEDMKEFCGSRPPDDDRAIVIIQIVKKVYEIT